MTEVRFFSVEKKMPMMTKISATRYYVDFYFYATLLLIYLSSSSSSSIIISMIEACTFFPSYFLIIFIFYNSYVRPKCLSPCFTFWVACFVYFDSLLTFYHVCASSQFYVERDDILKFEHSICAHILYMKSAHNIVYVIFYVQILIWDLTEKNCLSIFSTFLCLFSPTFLLVL